MPQEAIISVDRRGSDSIKWKLFGEDVLPLWVADTDFRSPEAVIAALHERVEHGVFGYPADPPELCELIAARMRTRYDWKITPKDILLVPGVVSGFNLVCQALTQPGESLMVQPPVYPPILQAAENAGARGIQAQLVRKANGSYEVDFDALEKLIEKDTRCLLLCNPHNPVGKVFSRVELERLAAICQRHRMILISDEIHSDLIFSGHQHTPVAALSEEISQNTVTLIAPSKTFNIAGLECSAILCTNPELLKRIDGARRGLLGHPNVLGLTAAIAAYQKGDAWLKSMMSLLEENRDFLANFLRSNLPKIKMRAPEATYLAWLDCRELELGEEPFKFFLREAKVGLNRGKDFGPGGEDFVRLNFGCTRQTLTEALEQMESALKRR